MRIQDREKFVCDICQGEFDIYPHCPETIIVKHLTQGVAVYTDVCIDCETKVADYINSVKG